MSRRTPALVLLACCLVPVAPTAAQAPAAAEAPAAELSCVAVEPSGRLAERAQSLVVLVDGLDIGAGILFARAAGHAYIVTANHVVAGPRGEVDDIWIQFRFTPPDRRFQARLLEHRDERLDIAILSVAETDELGEGLDAVPFDRLGEPEELATGAPVFPVGHPYGERWRVPLRPDLVRRVGSLDLDLEAGGVGPGSSGGGLFDERWELVGMVRAVRTGGNAEAVRIDHVVEKIAGDWEYPVDLQTAFRGLVIDALPWAEVVSLEDAAGEPVALPPLAYTPLALELPPGDYTGILSHPYSLQQPVPFEVRLPDEGGRRCTVVLDEIGVTGYFKEVGWWR